VRREEEVGNNGTRIGGWKGTVMVVMMLDVRWVGNTVDGGNVTDHMGKERARGFGGNAGKEGGASEFDMGCMVTQSHF